MLKTGLKKQQPKEMIQISSVHHQKTVAKNTSLKNQLSGKPRQEKFPFFSYFLLFFGFFSSLPFPIRSRHSLAFAIHGLSNLLDD